jgi:hypothetical protein
MTAATYIWSYIIEANRINLNLTVTNVQSLFYGLLLSFTCESITVFVSLICIIVQIVSLSKFIKTLKQQMKNGSDDKAKRIRSASQLVVGTIGTQMLITIIFLPSNINTFIKAYYKLTHMDVEGNKVSTAAISARTLPYINVPSNVLEQFIRDGENVYFPKLCVFSSTITIIIHLLTCPAYRRGAKRFIKRIFCCKKDNKVGTTMNAVSSKQTPAITNPH